MAKNTNMRGLLVYDSIYGATVETAYWVKAIIGQELPLEVKTLQQVITVEPFDYVIIGSATRMERPLKPVYSFVEKHRQVLARKQVCYFLTCGDCDETMILKVPGKAPHLIAGRNYLQDVQDRFPEIRPVVIGGFGGRQVMPGLNKKEALTLKLLEVLAREGTPWKGLDIWESLIPERVEAFANEVREKILSLPPCPDVEKLRGYWQSTQPANLRDAAKKKYTPKPYTVREDMSGQYFIRTRTEGDLDLAITRLQQWAGECGITLQEQSRTFFNVYYHAMKSCNGRSMTIHTVAATMPEDPGHVHASWRCYEKTAKRTEVQADIDRAEQILLGG